MIFFGFRYATGAWNVDNGRHFFGTNEFHLKHILAFSNPQTDGCTVDRIVFDSKYGGDFQVHLQFIRKDISQPLKYRFHLIYSTDNGRLFKQSIEHDRKTTIWLPTELFPELTHVKTK